MHTTHLRQVGGSVMLALPPALLSLLHMKSDEIVTIEIERGRLIIASSLRPHYSLKELLAQCDASAKFSEEDHVWLNSKPVGKELL